MNRPLLTGSIPWSQRIIALLVWLVGLSLAAALLVFGFFVGAALLGIAAIAALIAWVRLRWGKPILPRRAPFAPRTARERQTIVDAEYVVIRRDDR